MRSRSHALASSVIAGIILLSLYIGIGTAAADQKPKPPREASPASAKRTADNTPCLKCHEPFAAETLGRLHLQIGLGCVDCHGKSIAHARAGSGLLKPDVLFGRTQVDSFCQRCHDAPHKHPARVESWARKRAGQILPTGRKIMEHNICTDCHGEHV